MEEESDVMAVDDAPVSMSAALVEKIGEVRQNPRPEASCVAYNPRNSFSRAEDCDIGGTLGDRPTFYPIRKGNTSRSVRITRSLHHAKSL